MEHQIFEKIDKYKGADFFREMFKKAPKVFLDSCVYQEVPLGTRFVTAGESVDKIWLLILGEVKVLEEYITGDVYVFTRFKGLELFGEIEAIADIQSFSTSLVTAADCIFICFPTEKYLQFLKNDEEILFKRTRSIIKSVFTEVKINRVFLMLSAMDRIEIYFTKQYELYSNHGKCILKITREQIADETGLSIRTVNRMLKKLNEQKLVEISGHKLIINEAQYKSMLKDSEARIN